ncbi:RagB/SusD family nutrient uptake outer membrane protein [Dyadobacter sediminis]|uniref:RagB/SusD family nutrient uptake outer membrane protein n=1 Tax=Dyadobacter sediminis TaxID=1493691 RepID=A0A5R9KBY0_9BACT|nr:RagB/SusD family nutrient uptake outer membrane protein [Dyadobacter sediminis]TLU92239.1 RagB/SusD family nutrient uptake outer membrane protein [Dyadobacter sediminis]GGB96283.1 membrane protein [Dyadobacter sediminis]
MKKYIKTFASALLVSTLTLTSCNDVLDVSPPDKLSTGIFWKTESDADLALTGLYNYLYASGGGYATSQYQVFAWDTFSDDAYGQYNYGGGNSALSSGITPQSGDFVLNYYTNNYKAIAAINSFLANVGKVLTGEKLARYQGEAYFLRAFNYFWLAQLYGNVVITTEDPFTIDFKSTRAKSEKADVLKLIEEDLAKAISSLPDNAYKDGHAVKTTAQGYLVRVLLYEKKYAEAAALAKTIIAANKYSLWPNYAGNFYKPDQNSSTEIMFSVKYLQPNLLHQDVAVAVSLQRWKGEQGTQDLINEYEAIDGKPIATSAVYNPAKPFENRDPRMRQTFFFPGDTKAQGWPFTGDLSVATPGKDSWTVGFYPVKKWLDPAQVNPDYGAIDDNDFVLLRYADILLMFAEAENEANGPAAAIAPVNLVRKRAGMPALAAGISQSQLREMIRHERRVEFAMEGQRYFDLRRWGIAEQKLNGFVQNPLAPTIKSKYEAKYDLWPIPQTEIDRNAPVLTQNPGY